jgi:hypothetical protein
MLCGRIYVLYVRYEDGRDVPIEPHSVCDEGVLEDNKEWMDNKLDEVKKEKGVAEAKWVELELSHKICCNIEELLSPIVKAGGIE